MRTSYVTRQKQYTIVNAKVINNETDEIYETVVELPYIVKSDKQLEKLTRKALGDHETLIKVVSTDKKFRRFCMEESEFIKLAKEIEPRKMKTETEQKATDEDYNEE